MLVSEISESTWKSADNVQVHLGKLRRKGQVLKHAVEYRLWNQNSDFSEPLSKTQELLASVHIFHRLKELFSN